MTDILNLESMRRVSDKDRDDVITWFNQTVRNAFPRYPNENDIAIVTTLPTGISLETINQVISEENYHVSKMLPSLKSIWRRVFHGEPFEQRYSVCTMSDEYMD
tara:strand:+ start:3009 stop:3320 length:312 start_codon:yes stop_codon:yes gene_type:complete